MMIRNRICSLLVHKFCGLSVGPRNTAHLATSTRMIDQDKKISAARQSMEEAKKYPDAFFTELQHLVSSASRSLAGEAGTSVPHGSEDESESQLRPKKMRLTRQDLQGWVEELLRARKLAAEKKKNQPEPDTTSAADVTQSPPPSPPYPPFPSDGTSNDVMKWHRECHKNTRPVRSIKGQIKTVLVRITIFLPL